jgi:hypothetical protein
MTRAGLVALLSFGIASAAWGQASQQLQPPARGQAPSGLGINPPAADQRGTEKEPLAVKVLSAPKSESDAAKEEYERAEKAALDEKLAFDTQRIADYTGYLAAFTVMLAAVAIVQASFFLVQLKLMRTGTTDATIAANAAKDAATAAKDQAAAMKASVELWARIEDRRRSVLDRAYIAGGGQRRMTAQVGITGQRGRLVTDKFEVHTSNQGRTAAHLQRIRYGFCSPGEILRNVVPPYSRDEHFRDLIGPGSQRLTAVITLPDKNKSWAIFVRFEYYDVSQNQDAWAGFVVKLEEGEEFPVPLEAPEAYTEPVLRNSVSNDTGTPQGRTDNRPEAPSLGLFDEV